MARRRKTKRSAIQADKDLPPARRPIMMPPKPAVEAHTTSAPASPLAGLPLELRWMILKHLTAYPNMRTHFSVSEILATMHKSPAFEHDFATLFLPQQNLYLHNPRFLESKWLDRLSIVVRRSVLVLDLSRCLDSAALAQMLRALSLIKGLKWLRVVFHANADLGVSAAPLMALVVRRGSEVEWVKTRIVRNGIQEPAVYWDLGRWRGVDGILGGLTRKRVLKKGRGLGMLRELVCE